MSKYLFSYGTLLPEHAPAEIASTVAKLRPFGKGSVPGIVLDLGKYPGAVLDGSSRRKIFGTVFRLPADPAVLKQLDRYEGFNPAAPSSSLFIRRRHPVELSNGRVVECWIYEYNGKRGSAPVMANGRYRKREFTAK